MRHSLPPSDVCQKLSLSLFYCNKSFTTPSFEWLKPSLWSRSKIVSFRSRIWTVHHKLSIPIPFVRSPGSEAWCGVQNLHNSARTSLVLLFSCLWVTHLASMGFDSFFNCCLVLFIISSLSICITGFFCLFCCCCCCLVTKLIPNTGASAPVEFEDHHSGLWRNLVFPPGSSPKAHLLGFLWRFQEVRTID